MQRRNTGGVDHIMKNIKGNGNPGQSWSSTRQVLMSKTCRCNTSRSSAPEQRLQSCLCVTFGPALSESQGFATTALSFAPTGDLQIPPAPARGCGEGVRTFLGVNSLEDYGGQIPKTGRMKTVLATLWGRQ